MDLTDLIGNTPLVDLVHMNRKPNVKLLGKLEGNNPGSSVKDRAAYSMIKGADDRGELKPGIRIIEPTSGNTGIALAMIASRLGHDLVLVMPESATKERVQTMRAFGAEVVLTNAEQSMEGAIDYAREKVAEGGYYMLNQFGNPDNWKAHYQSTGPEIWRDSEKSVSHFVSAMGTTGTIMGVSRFLKEKNPAIQIVGVQPKDGASIPGIRRWPPAYLPAIFEKERVDTIVDVSQEEAVHTTRRLANEEGVFCGMSSGGAVFAALEVCQQLDEGVVVVILCDRGDRYLSSALFE